MNNTRKIVTNYIYIYRQLQQNYNKNSNQTTENNDIQKEQLRDLYIYIGVLVALIILILGGYALYRKCIEKRALHEMEREYQLMIMNLMNSNSSQASSYEEDRRPHSYNNINQNNIRNNNNQNGNNINNSLDFNYEERMENIRKKFGNSLVIKCLLKRQIEEIKYIKSYGEEYGDNCTICMENFIENAIISKTPCEHIFHKKCFDTYLKEIQKKDKLSCPNCNQNLLVNKKFLKLRAKTKKVEVKRNVINKKEVKESELNLENDLKNRNSEMTNKNDDPLTSNNNNDIIFIKKKGKKEKKEKIKNIELFNEKNENDIYNPLQIRLKKKGSENSKIDKDTALPVRESKEKIGESEEMNNLKKRTFVLVNNFSKKTNSLKNSISSKNESKSKVVNKRKINASDVNSERDCIVFTKKTCAPIMSSSK